MDFDFSKPYPKPGSYKSAIQFLDKLWAFSAQMNDKLSRTTQANSINSSLPPSSDSLKIKAERKKEDWQKRAPNYWKKRKQGDSLAIKFMADSL